MKKTEMYDRDGYNANTDLFKSRYYATKWLEKHHMKNQKAVIKMNTGYWIMDNTAYCDKETRKLAKKIHENFVKEEIERS